MSKNFFSMGVTFGFDGLAELAALTLTKIAALVFRRPQAASFFPCRFLRLLCTSLVRIFAIAHDLTDFTG